MDEYLIDRWLYICKIVWI